MRQVQPRVQARGAAVFANVDLALGKYTGRTPDIAVWFARPPTLSGSSAATMMPNLVVEILSARPRDVQRDRVDKLAEYAAARIPHYWLVEPLHQVLEVYHRRRRTDHGHTNGSDCTRVPK